MRKQEPAQAVLERPVCNERFVWHVCTLLKDHDGKHVSSKGHRW